MFARLNAAIHSSTSYWSEHRNEPLFNTRFYTSGSEGPKGIFALADFGRRCSWQRAPPFRGVGVNVLDAGLLTALLQKNRSRCFHTTFAHGKRKVIEIKRDLLRTRRGRLFNRKIDALVTFSMTASRHSEQCRLV